jgi:hypothetical protein
MSPALILSLTLAIFYGSVAHVVLGRRLWQWPLFLATSLAGFFGGFLAAVTWGFEWLRVGEVPLLTATLGAAACISLAWFFSAPAAGPTAPDSNG